MAKANLCGATALSIKEIFMKILYKDTVCINGQTTESTMGNGWIIKCMVMVSLLGKMANSILEIMSMIKKKEKENFDGLMDKYSKDTGKMVNKMVPVS